MSKSSLSFVWFVSAALLFAMPAFAHELDKPSIPEQKMPLKSAPAAKEKGDMSVLQDTAKKDGIGKRDKEMHMMPAHHKSYPGWWGKEHHHHWWQKKHDAEHDER